MNRVVKWLLVAVGVLVVIAVGFFAFVVYELDGRGGWEPNRNSSQAARATTLDAQLHLGMTRNQVKRIFEEDAAAHPNGKADGDGMEDSSDAYWGEGYRQWAIETDFYIFEPRPHWWNSFDTMWTVRARFNQKGILIEHQVHLGDCCGP